jgi:hypothetical protein
MNEKNYKAGAALCPSCASVIEFFYGTCPWCSHEIKGQEAMKVFSMLSETGVPAEDLRAQILEAGRVIGDTLLPFCDDNFEKGSQGAKMASLLVLQTYGDLVDLKVGTLEEGYKKSSNPVKVEIIRTLSLAGTQDGTAALERLKDFENDPEVLLAFSTKLSADGEEKAIREEISLTEISTADLQVEEAKRAEAGKQADKHPPPVPTARKADGEPSAPKKVPPPPPAPIPSALDILPPLPEIPEAAAEQPEPDEVVEPRKSKVLPIILIGAGFIATGVIVLVLLLALGIKIPLVKKSGTTTADAKGSKVDGGPVVLVDAGGQGEEAAADATAAPGEADAVEEAAAEAVEEEPAPEEPSGPIKVAGTGQLSFTISASSEHNEFPASNMIDGNPGTVWQEERKIKPYGHVITLDFGKQVTVTNLTFISGYDASDKHKGDLFPLNNRLKKASLTFSDGTTREIDLEDKREKQTITLAPEVRTAKIDIKILDVYRGSWFFDNAIAEIEVGGHE